MKFSEKYIILKNKNKIFIRSWLPEQKAKKCILIVHGLGEHSGRYEDFGLRLTKKKIGIYSFDLPGHGNSDGRKGHIQKFSEFIDATEQVLIHIRRNNLECQIVLFGHSLGGLIALNFLIDRESREIESAIISSPWIKLAIEVPKYLLNIQRVFKNLFPSLSLNNRINPLDLSKDQKIINEYINDKNVHDRISIKLYSEVVDSIQLVKEKSEKIKIRTLIYHGKNDRLISYHGSEEINKKINNSELNILNNVYHEPHNDIEKDLVFDKIYKFLEIK